MNELPQHHLTPVVSEIRQAKKIKDELDRKVAQLLAPIMLQLDHMTEGELVFLINHLPEEHYKWNVRETMRRRFCS